MERTKVKCSHCGSEISKSNIAKHEAACTGNVSKVSYKLTHDGLDCQFCSKTCKNRNSLCNHERMCSLNPNRQVSVGFAKYNEQRKQGEIVAWNKGLTANSDVRVAKQAVSIKKYYETHNGSWFGRKHTEDEKARIGASVKKFLLDNPDMVPYIRNHSSTESYPEQYFKELFELENISLKYHHRVGIYELDFCDLDKKLDIEIDGEQHYLDERIVRSDVRRNEYLEQLGWTVFRIRWADFKKYSDEEKANLILTIKDLLM